MEPNSKLSDLPVVKISKFPFYVDLEGEKYIDKQFTLNVIRDEDLRWLYGQGANGVLFDTKIRNISTSELQNGKLPAHIIKIQLPLTSNLDIKLLKPKKQTNIKHAIGKIFSPKWGKDLEGPSL